MSNKLINAVIALVEDRPKDAREMLRSPEMKVGVSEVQNRLTFALQVRETKAKVEALKSVLRASLHINAIEATEHLHLDPSEFYLMGVAEVEEIIDDFIQKLEA